MIGEDMKGTAFQEVSKVFDTQIDGEEFAVKRTIAGLGRL